MLRSRWKSSSRRCREGAKVTGSKAEATNHSAALLSEMTTAMAEIAPDFAASIQDGQRSNGPQSVEI